MFEIAWSELFIVLIVAIIVVGPKELPGMLRTFGRMMGKLRRSADDFRRQFDESMRDVGGEDIQRELNELRRHNPLNEIRNTIEQAAREATDPPRLPIPETYLDKPEAPPETLAGAEPAVTPAPVAAVPAPSMPATAEAALPPVPAAPSATQPAPAAEPAPPAKEQGVATPTHEPLVNGQHRPLN